MIVPLGSAISRLPDGRSRVLLAWMGNTEIQLWHQQDGATRQYALEDNWSDKRYLPYAKSCVPIGR